MPRNPNTTLTAAQRKVMKAIGSMGGTAAARNMTPEQRKARSQAALKARAAKAKKAKRKQAE